MIGYIKGVVEETDGDAIILDNSGVGYRVFVPAPRCLSELSAGTEAKVYIHMSVREDGVSLFGFTDKDDLECYRLLLVVSGVGPKAAMSIMSYMDASELRLAVLTDDVSKIAKASGIGKKTAQKIILELKDRFSIDDIAFGTSDSEASVSTSDPAFEDAFSALVALGYSSTSALKAVRTAAAENNGADTETLLKAALKYLL